MWLNLVVAVIVGGMMGLLGHAKKLGKIERPRITKKFIYLGFVEEVVIGTVAAVLVVVSTETDSLFKVIFLSMLAGYGGEAVMSRIDILKIQDKTKETASTESNEK